MNNNNSPGEYSTPAPSMAQAIRIWAKIGVLSFGGPAAQIALMHRLVVEEMKWLNEKDYLNALSFCMLLPGPEAMQLATYAGWRLHGIVGGLAAGLLFVLPGAVLILALAMIYAAFGSVPLVEALFLGIKSAVLIVVVEALLRIGKKSLNNVEHQVIAALAFIAIFFFNLPFPLIVVGAGVFGLLRPGISSGEQVGSAPIHGSLKTMGTTVIVMMAIWWLPLFAIGALSSHAILVDIGSFFSRLAVVTFGGAYAVLAYLGQDVVSQWGWLTAGEMMDGLGLAETTPGPLILVTEFVGYIAAYREGGIALGIAGAAVTLWTTFVPCFLWIFAGAPYIEWICSQPRLNSALSAISAAVVGVILNLSIWFALHVMFQEVSHQQRGMLSLWVPALDTVDWRVVLLTGLSGFLGFGMKWSIQRVLGVASVSGALLVYFPGLFG